MPVERSDRINLLKRIHLFRSYDDEALGRIADLMEEMELPADTVIYSKNENPEFFYIIVSGNVRLIDDVPTEPQAKVLGKLEQDDYFGVEVLETGWPNQISAISETEAVLLRLSVPAFQEVLAFAPSLAQRLQLILDSYRLSLKVGFDWLEPNELIFYVARRHVLFMVLNILPPLVAVAIFIPVLLYFALTTGFFWLVVLLGIVLVGLLGWLAWAYVDWTNDFYVITAKRVVYQERVVLLYDSRQEAPLDAIQSGSTNTTQIGRLLGYGNVVIRTYYGTILFKEVASPDIVMSLLQDQQYHAQVYQRWNELGEIRKRLDTRLKTGPKMPQPPRVPVAPPIPPDKFRQFITTMLHQRYEVSGTIIYRTHWFILLKKIWAPLLIILGLLVVFLVSARYQFPIISFQATFWLSFFIFLIAFAWMGYQYWDWHNDVYLIGQEKIEDVNKKPLGREDRRSAQLNKIQNIEYKRLGLLGLLFNFGTVYIQVGDQKLTFDDVYKPAEVQRELFHSLSKRQQKDREAQMESDRQRMEDWLYVYNSMNNKMPPEAPRKIRGGF